MCLGMSYPNPIGERISQLKPGDEIIILEGEGFPPVSKETCTLIWKIDRYSALTTDGISLSCTNVSDLIVTGNSFQTYDVSPEAMLIWGNILAARKEAQDPEFQPDWSVPDPFPAEPE